MTKRYSYKTGNPAHIQNTRDAINNRTEFSNATGTLSGGTPGGWGLLNVEEKAKFLADRETGTLDYAVYSYKTPIAWHTEDGWYLVSQKWGVITSTQQSFVRRTLCVCETRAIHAPSSHWSACPLNTYDYAAAQKRHVELEKAVN